MAEISPQISADETEASPSCGREPTDHNEYKMAEGTDQPISIKLSTDKIKALIIIALSNFCYGACVSLYGPFFPPEASRKDVSPSIYGLVIGSFQLAVIVFSPLVGKMISTVSSKLMLCVGTFTLGSCTIFFGLLDLCTGRTPFIALAFLIRLAQGFGAVTTKCSIYTIIASQFPLHLGTIFASTETFFGLGLIIGPIVGGALFDAGGFGVPFYSAGGLTVVSAICAAIILPESGKIKLGVTKNFCSWAKHPGIVIYFLVIFTSFFYTGFLMTTLEPHLRQFHLSGFFLGLLFPISGFVYSLTAPGWGWIVDKGFNNLLLIVFGCICNIASILLIGPVLFLHIKSSLAIISAALVLKGLGQGGKLVCSFYGALRDTVARDFPDDATTHGRVAVMYTFSLASGAFVGPSISGYVYDTIGFENGTLIILVLEAVTMTIAFVYAFMRHYRNPHHHHSSREEQQPILHTENQFS